MADSLDVILALQQSIPQLNQAIAIEPILKGVSADKKWIIRLPNNEKQLLRMFDLTELTHKQMEYEAITAIESFGVKCCKPLAFGELVNSNQGYMLLSFIEGDDATDELLKLTETEQYQIGVETGRELRLVHQLEAPASISPWYDRAIAQHQACMDEYAKFNVDFKHESKVMAFIEEHIELMKDCPNVFLHEDIHPGNIIIKERQFSGLIDFNRYEWGDPVRDFLKMGMFSKSLSIPFSIGQVKGYHQNQDPDELFWGRYALYLAMSLFSSIVWIWSLEPEDKARIMHALDLIMEDQNNFDSCKPTWYR
jgi:aminoglycoside phosphotransferase (APT) family kinase protein